MNTEHSLEISKVSSEQYYEHCDLTPTGDELSPDPCFPIRFAKNRGNDSLTQSALTPLGWRISPCTMVGNDAEVLLEWLKFHCLHGVDRVVFYLDGRNDGVNHLAQMNCVLGAIRNH